MKERQVPLAEKTDGFGKSPGTDGFLKSPGNTNETTKAVWDYLVGSLRKLYIMDELWDDKSELKFRRSGKTLVTLYLKPDKVTALVIFGKAEREKFGLCHDDFSPYIQGYYDSSKTFHDGKWMFIDVSDLAAAKEIIGLVAIKKKPNRKTIVDS